MRLQARKTTPETAYLVRQDDTLEAALMAIEANNHRSVIVVDERRVVVGTNGLFAPAMRTHVWPPLFDMRMPVP